MRIFLLAAALLLPLSAQEPPADAPKPRRPRPEPRNLQVLKVPGAELMPIMRGYTAALGVQCNFCHVQGDFASDDNRHKLTARKMIAMTEQVNGHFDGKARVSCYTCHRGEPEPKSAPEN